MFQREKEEEMISKRKKSKRRADYYADERVGLNEQKKTKTERKFEGEHEVTD